ncbi:MAG: hypothetical protein AB8D78_15670 [Akkermansiaceae bacterium]
MKPNFKKPKSGFALVATVLLMVLLSILALGMLSLSAVSVRTSSRSDASAEARANARMALMMAIERLQSELGPDQRISANGSILSTSPVRHPRWTGVWNSWKAESIEGGTPISSHQTIEGVSASDGQMAPTYQSNREDYFRSWLVSVNPQNSVQLSSALNLELTGDVLPDGQADAVALVSNGSVSELTDPNSGESNEVVVPLVSVTDKDGSTKTGRYGWWVGDESQKARVMADSYVTSPASNDAEKIYRAQSPGSTGTATIAGLEGLTDEAQIDGLASLATLDLVDANRDENDTRKPTDEFHSITPYSYGVLADVREGGLKRDLSTILEQPISRENDGQEFMLYEFDDPRFPFQSNPNDERRANSRVPIQDLAAYYQLYDHQAGFANGRREGVQYTSTALPNTLQVKVPDHDGGSKNRERLIREYTSLYRRPVVTKVQFLVGVSAQPITDADRQMVLDQMDQTTGNPPRARYPNLEPIRDSDTHKLRLGIMPMVTLWNPSNLPLVMDATQRLRYNNPPFGIRWRKHRSDGEDFESTWFNLGYASNPGSGTSNGQGGGFDLLKLRFAPGSERIVFEPGEVKVFSVPSSAAANLTEEGNVLQLSTEDSHLDTVNEWDPFGVFLMRNSAAIGHNYVDAPDVIRFDNLQRAQCMVFSPSDKITFSIEPDNENVTVRADGRSASSNIEGAGFSLLMVDEGYQSGHWSTWSDSLRHNFMLSRNGNTRDADKKANLRKFHGELMFPGFPGEEKFEFDSEANAIQGSQIIAASNADEIIAVTDFSLSIGCESSTTASGGFGGGRRITSRPFLHSATAAMPFIAQSEKDSLYDYGWDWQVSKINTVEDSIMQAKPDSGNGYYGGGYTVELGTTHVIQSEVPILPSISIASLSHAHLGGFSLAYAIPVGENPDTDTFWWKSGPVKSPSGVAYQRTTASGQNGLAPHIVQAIGNSYAHPNIPADKAFTTKERTFDLDEGAFEIPYVDHSYLANKALWDEFFFSSIAPQPSNVELFGGVDRSAKDVAEEFFQLENDSPSIALPNRRMRPYTSGLNPESLDELFNETDLFSDGLADKIAAHLMVQGAFNINSTSADAWKIFLSSLKGKPVAYLDGGSTPQEETADGATVSSASLLKAAPIQTSEIQGPNTPPSQWAAGRELTDQEIEELANAIVKQVKLRGPFLSLSEFVNRRLESGNPDLAKMGALQAALNDSEVSINANFRQSNRTMDSEVAGINFEFPEAAGGPIAYGSSAYVDQADLLRGFAGQLTPRGDTFVIRAYGDSLDVNGDVQARAWCEAVIQRTPEYIDPTDESYVRQVDLTPANQNFGRKFTIQSFRWLNADEV